MNVLQIHEILETIPLATFKHVYFKDLGSRVYALIVTLTEQQLGAGVRFPRMVVLKIHSSQSGILVDLLRQVVYTRRLAGIIAGHHVEFQTRVGLQGVPVDVHSA
ncbi:hypothetical protein AcW1_001965 [Taiwanofungus camphoratus]|nr:hypothetical protein AcW1_001965 [Antrodia cinnamomea]